jgi:large conductance mechanosensitive channel
LKRRLSRYYRPRQLDLVGLRLVGEGSMRVRTWGTEFRQFLLRGNVIDLAVGIVIGAAFNEVVQTFVKALLTPLIAAMFGKPDFSALAFTINQSKFQYGLFLNALISFLIIAFAVFFFVVKPVNTLTSLARHREPPDPNTRKCPECLSEIPLQARRCAFCTAEVGAVGPPADQR